MRARFKLAVVLGAAVVFSVVATAQGQTRHIFQRISTNLLSEGYTRVIEPYSGWLDDNESSGFTVWLRRGEQYAITAACDRDCSDVDLQLLSPERDEVASDWALDDEPLIIVRPTRSGHYEVRVSMASCSVEPCEYIVGVFRQ